MALLEVDDVVMTFGGVRALAGVDLAVDDAELRCIIGPNGCGKTTLFNVITGTLAPTSGSVRLAGRAITGLRPHQISRLGVARKFQVPGIYPSLAVAENLEVPRAAARGQHGPWHLLRHRPGGPDLRDHLARFGLAQLADRPAGALAHGQKQWLEIAMLLAGEVRLLLLDEPTAGMTAPETRATADLIGRIRAERGVAVVVIEHDMSFVRRLDCPVVMMMRGRVFREGTYEGLQRDPEVRAAYLGQARAC